MHDIQALLAEKEHEHAQLAQAHAELQRRLQEVTAALFQAQGAVQVLRTLASANGTPVPSEVRGAPSPAQ